MFVKSPCVSIYKTSGCAWCCLGYSVTRPYVFARQVLAFKQYSNSNNNGQSDLVSIIAFSINQSHKPILQPMPKCIIV